MAVAYIAIGSNLGDREALIARSIERLEAVSGVRVRRCSSVIETEPVGPPQPKYLNAVCCVETSLGPEELMAVLHRIEAELGRERTVRWGPRTIDLDLLFYDDRVVTEGALRIPHPRAAERRFVLEPLAEIAPDLVHPELKKTVSELLAELE